MVLLDETVAEDGAEFFLRGNECHFAACIRGGIEDRAGTGDGALDHVGNCADRLKGGRRAQGDFNRLQSTGHGPQDADVLRGRTVTSVPNIRKDLENAGANWKDDEVIVDKGLVTSRTPEDLPAFCAKLVEEIAEGRHGGQRRSA